MKRIIAFDYIRVISITGIVLCHFLYNYDSCRSLAGWLGNTFNTVFITISAFLMGFKWEKGNRQALKFSFLTDRIKKLSYTYYPFLLLMFLFILLVEQHTPTIKEILLHFGFSPVFQRIPNWSHLWFVSMITLCYTGIYVYSQMVRIKISPAIIALTGVIGLAIVEKCNFSPILSNAIIYICIYISIFTNTKPLFSFMEKQNSRKKTFISLAFVTVCIILYHNIDKSNLHGLIIGVFSAILLFIPMFNFFNSRKEYSLVSFISGISFEIYLVHYIFTLSDYSIAKYIENPFWALLIIFAVCIISAYCLKRISLERFFK